MDHDSELVELVKVARKAALAAGEPIKHYFRSNRDGHSDKNDKSSIVTMADIEAEKAMRRVIGEHFPDHSVQGEELPETVGPAPYTWILDPIDGTSNFAMGKPIFGCLIAVFKDEKPIIGVIYQPILGELFIGIAGERTVLNTAPLQTSHISSLTEALMATNPPYMFESPLQKRVLSDLSGTVRSCEYGGDCYNYAMLAAGHIDIALSSGDAFHDFAALIPVVLGAGGCITDWFGNALGPYSDGNIIAAANPGLHASALARIRSAAAQS